MAARSENLAQPSKLLLIELCTLADFEMCCQLVDVLEQFFALICSMSGAPRIPLFGLAAVGDQGRREILLSLQQLQVRSNFSHIQSTLVELKSLAYDWSRIGVDETLSCTMVEGISEVLTMYQQQAQSLMQAAGHCSSQLEVIIFTTRASSSIVSSLRETLQSFGSQVIKKVQVVSSCVRKGYPENLEPSQQGSGDSQLMMDDLCGIIESTVVPPDFTSMRHFFMSWFHNESTDSEHLRLNFDGLCVKCDVKDSIISPLCLQPVMHKRYYLSKFEVPASIGGGAKSNIAMGGDVKLLEIVSRVPMDSICDSLTFGSPLLLCATSCWQLEWDDLQMNCQNFRALCHLLSSQKEALIAKLCHHHQKVEAANKRNSNIKAKPLPNGLFVLVPSAKGTLLLKAIVGNELYLPNDPMAEEGSINDDSLCVVSAVLDEVATASMYNPIDMVTDLSAALLAQLVSPTQAYNQQSAAKKHTSGFTEAASGFTAGPGVKSTKYGQSHVATTHSKTAAAGNEIRTGMAAGKVATGGKHKLLNTTSAFNLDTEFDFEF